METKRIQWVDTARGIALLLIVLAVLTDRRMYAIAEETLGKL